jgi:hypothetical protein
MEWVTERLAAITAVASDEADGFAKNFAQDLFALLDHGEQLRAVEFLRSRSVDFNWIATIDSGSLRRAFD